MSGRDRIWTLSNLLSIVRIFFLVPILINLSHEQRWWVLVWTVLVVSTDFLDGYFARRLNQRSDFGRIIDPLADKIVVLGAVLFMIISPHYDFPLWFFLFILTREISLMFCSFLVIRRKSVVIESNRPGKNSAFATGLAVLLYAMRFQPYARILLWIAFILTLYSSWGYFRLFIQQMKVILPQKVQE